MNHITRRELVAFNVPARIAAALLFVAGTLAVPALAGDLSSPQRTAMQPRIVQFAYPEGSAMAYGLEISEDRDGDGIYDTRFVREHDGRWTINCWPKACDRQIVRQMPLLSVHHDFVAVYHETHGIYVWELREYDRTDSRDPIAILCRSDKDTYTYTTPQNGLTPLQLLAEHQQPNRIQNPVQAVLQGSMLTLTYDSPSASRSLLSVMNLRGRALTRKAFTPTTQTESDQRTHVTISVDGLPKGTHAVWVADETSIHATQFTLR